MKLEEYMKKHKLTTHEMSRLLNITYVSMWQILTGKRRPSLDLAIEIELLTKSQVPCIEWKKESKKILKDPHKTHTSLSKKKKTTKDTNKDDT